jgi:hypothetical protein
MCTIIICQLKKKISRRPSKSVSKPKKAQTSDTLLRCIISGNKLDLNILLKFYMGECLSCPFFSEQTWINETDEDQQDEKT